MLQLKYKNNEKGPLWLVEPKYSIGSASNCDLRVQESGVKDHAADLVVDGDNIKIIAHARDGSLKVNGHLVNSESEVAAGDLIICGTTEFYLIDPKKEQPKAAVSAQTEVVEWSLQALNTALANNKFLIEGDKVVGRSKEADISLGVAHLSRKHARLKANSSGLFVEDLNSSNGTFVNGKRVQSSQLKAGDELAFDTLKFRVIGPKEDVDETTVRPVVRVSEDPSPQAPAAAKRAGHKAERGQKARGHTPTASPSVSANARPQSNEKYVAIDPEEKSKAGLWIGIVVGVVVAAAVAFFISQ